MWAYSLDLRTRILRACDAGDETREGVADTFGVSRAFVFKLLHQREQTGAVAARPHAGGPAGLVDEPALGELRALVKARPDATLAELAAAVRGRGGPAVSAATVCRALQVLELPVKKSRCTRASGTPRGSGGCGRRGGVRPSGPTRAATSSWTRAGRTPP